MTYEDFLLKKRHNSIDFGIPADFIPDTMFDFQKHVAEYAIKKGRGAVFLDTGLGKTLIELVVAANYVKHTNKPVLIITPLAVANQHLLEAGKFGINDVEHTRDGKYKGKIILINYERLHYLNSSDFDCVILDESSILKNFDGAIKNQINSFLRKVKYRFLFTATPSPNDYIELGTSSEALGYLGYMDMLGKFFKNNQNNVAKISQISKARQGESFYLKPHAENDFWQWVASWSISAKKPSDLGYDDERFILPELHEIETILRNENPLTIDGQTKLFAMPAVGFHEIKQEAKATIRQRCEMAVEKCLQHEISFCWVNLNAEGDYLESMLPNSVQISGKDDIDKKEEAIEWFTGRKCICNSQYFGVNWQNKNKEKICGNQNMQNGEGQNIEQTPPKEISENLNVELLRKIRNTWQNTIKEIQTSSCIRTKRREIQNAENITQIIQNIERNASNYRFNIAEKIAPKDLNVLLGHMELQLRNIIQYLKINNSDALYAEIDFSWIKENQWLLIIAIQPKKLEEFYVNHVTLDLGTLRMIFHHLKTQYCTCGHLSGVRRLISKTEIFGFGLNLQHCNHTTYFPTYSYEQYYQAIRRFWRFGQTRPVTVDLILSDGQERIMQSLIHKKDKAIKMFEKLTQQTNKDFTIKTREFNKQINLPKFI